LLALDAGLYRVLGPNRSSTFAVNAPPILPSQRITPTDTESAAITGESTPYQGTYLWQWLVLLAMVALWAEWWLFYSQRVNQRAVLIQQSELQVSLPPSAPAETARKPGTEKEDALDPNFIT
jgi:hypothetical protein